MAKVPKYTYVSLSELKPGAVVNVYGVVVFFKQPCRTRGTGQCSLQQMGGMERDEDANPPL